MMDLNPGKKDVPDPEMLGGELASPEEHLLEAIQRKEMSKWEKMVEIVTKSLPGNSEKRAIDAVLRALIAAGYVVVKIPNSMTPVWIALHTGHSWDEEYIARNTPLMRDFLKELLAAGEVKPAKEAK